MSRDIPLALIDPDPEQPRKHFDPATVAELAQSLAADGLAVPILLRPHGERYLIVHGERRWRAAQSLGWAAIPAEVRDLTPEAAGWLQLVENIQRQDLTPLDEAEALDGRLRREKLTQAKLGERIGKSQSYIAGKLRLLQMPAALQAHLARTTLSEGHCRQLLRLKDLYHGLTVQLPDPNAWGPAPDERPSIYVLHMLDALRPEDQPPGYFALWPRIDQLAPEAPRLAALVAATEALAQRVQAAAGTAPLWELRAWWWATWTVGLEASVATLHTALDHWQERFYSTVCWEFVMSYQRQYPPSKPTPEAVARVRAADWEPAPEDRYTLQWLERYALQSDVRHGRIGELLGNADKARVGELLVAAFEAEADTLPSAWQRWGEEARLGEALLELDAQARAS